MTPQSIADHLYAEIDAANERLELIGAAFRFRRVLDILDHKPAVVARINHTGMTCRACGGMTKQAGTCHVCTNCGETSECSG